MINAYINKRIRSSRVLPVLVYVLLAAACSNHSGSTRAFVLNGTVQGMPDSTWLLLRYATPGTPPDSTQVIGGRFRFVGQVNDTLVAAQAIVTTRSMEDYKFLWLENTEMTFSGIAGQLRTASITGSVTQQEADILQSLVSPVTQAADSLRTIWYRMSGAAEREASGLEEQIRALDAEQQTREIAFVQKHPASLVSVYVLSIYSATWGRTRAGELFAALSPANKRSVYGQTVQQFLMLNKDLDTGDRMIDIEQPAVAGNNMRLSDVKARYILLEFWASWCGPCRRENPELVKTYHTYKPAGFEIFGVSLDDDRDRWTGAIQTDGLPWINVSELNGDQNTAVVTYGINSIPDNFLIDSTGVIIGRNLRGEQLRERLAELLPAVAN